MKPKFRHLRSLAIASSALLSISYVQAQSGSWLGDSAGNWSDGTKWTGGIVANGADNTATFGNVITADRIITLDRNRTIGNITASDTGQNYTISGANILTLDRTDLTAPTIDVITSRTLTISSVIAGNDGLQKTGAGTLSLGNTVNQFTGNTLITNGKVTLGGQYSMWQSAYDTTGSTGAIGLTVTGQATPWLGGLAGSVNLATAITGYTAVTSLRLNPQSGSSVSYGGVIANGSGAMTLEKTGHGNQTLTGTNTYSGATTVWAGTLSLAGASGTAQSTAITVRGGTLLLDNSTAWADRIADTGAASALSLGSLTLTSDSGTTARTETVGATTFAVGGKVTVNNNTTGGSAGTTLALGTATRSAGAAIDFVGTGGTLGGGANSPNVTSTGTFAGGSNGILPWATVNGTTWAGTASATSIVAYGGGFDNPTSAASNAANNAQLTGTGSIASAKAFNSLNVITSSSGQSLNLASGANLNLTSGAILKSGTDDYTISSGGGILGAGATGTGTELIAHVNGGALTISAPLNGVINSIAKGGTGDLILSGTRKADFNGNTSIAGGQLEFRGAGFTISGVVTGAGGLTVNLNAGQTLFLNNNSNSYAGPTIVKGGYLASNAFNAQGVPGGIIQTPGSSNTSLIMSNVTLEGGVWYSRYVTNKDLGAGPGQVQILAGTSGFAHDASQGGAAGFTLDGGREIVWGSAYFNPTAFVHNTTGNLTLNLANGFDLAGSTRTVLVGDATISTANGVSQLGGNIRNSSGTAGLTKTGIGTLLLTGTNTYNGATTVSSGILRIGNQVSLYNNTPASWTAANIVVANTGTLALNVGGTGQFTTGNVTTLLTNLGGANGTSTTGFAAGSSIGFDTTNAAGSTFTVANDIADSSGAGGGAIGVVKLGSNTLVLSGTNSYSGATVIRGGTLSLTGSLTGNTAISTADNNNGGGGTALQGILNQSAAGVISGATASFTQGSTGTSILAGNNSYGGGTTLNAGTLTVAHANALGTGTGTIALNGGTIQSSDATARTFTNAVTIGNPTIGGTGNLTFSNTGTSALGGNRTITVTNSGTTATFAQAFTGTGNSITKAGAGTLVLSGNNSGVTGGTTLTGGTLILAGSTALPAGAITFGTTNTTLRFENDSNLAITNTLTTSNRSLNRTLVVDRLTTGAAVNLSFSSVPNLDCGTVLNFQAGSDITSGTPTITFSGGTTSSDSNNGTIAGGTGANGAVRFNPTGVNVVINGIASSGRTRGYILDGTSTGNRVTGTWANGSGTEVLKTGTGTWTLAGTSQYTLTTTIDNGTLQFEKQTALYNNTPASWTAANLIVKSGGTLAFNVGGTGEFTTGNVSTLLGNLAASSSATNGMNAGSNFGFNTANASGGTFTIADVIADSTGATGGARGLTKLGINTLVLTNTNTYTGATTVNAGTLEVALGGSTAAGSAVTVSNSGSALVVNGTVGGTLNANVSTTVSGSGTVTGAATVAGALNPGTSPGVLSFSSSLAMANTTATTMEINGAVRGTGYDGIDVGTALTYDGSLTLALGTTFGTNQTFNLFDLFTSQAGDFDAVALTGSYTATFTNNLGVWSATTNSGNESWVFTQSSGDLVFTVIPEPDVAALIGALGGMLLLRRRR